MNTRVSAFVLSVLVELAIAQSPREPLRGTASRADGAPWIGATVHLLTRHVANDERIGAADEVTATTDERGRFLAELLVGRAYVAWAYEPLDGDLTRMSLAREHVLAGQPLQLTAHSDRTPTRVRFAGLDAWRQRGGVVARCVSTTLPVVVTEQRLIGDEWRVPPLPSATGFLELVCDGVPLLPWPRHLSLTEEPGRPIAVAPPRDLVVEVLDTAGRPVADAELAVLTSNRAEVRGTEGVVGRTGADGRATVTVPMRADRRFRWVNYSFGVRAAGHAPLANIAEVDIPAGDGATAGAPALSIQLPPGARHRVRLHEAGEAWSRRLLVRTPPASIGGVGRPEFYRPIRAQTADADGRIEVLRCADERAVLLAATEELTPPEAVVREHPIALLGVIDAGETRADLDVDLGRLRRVTVAVTRDRVPVEAARLAVVVGAGRTATCAFSDVITDRTGRVRVVLPPGEPVTIVAWDARGLARLVRFDAAHATTAGLELEPVPVISGTLTGADGDPAAGVGLRTHVYGSTDDASFEIGAAIERIEVRTANDGTFALPLFPGLQYLGVRRMGDQSGPDLHPGWTVGEDTPETLDLEIGGRD